jgi:hypothetical protein
VLTEAEGETGGHVATLGGALRYAADVTADVILLSGSHAQTAGPWRTEEPGCETNKKKIKRKKVFVFCGVL